MAETLRRIRDGGAMLLLVLLAVAAQAQQEYEVTSSSSSLPSRRGAGEGHQQLPWAQQEYEVTSAATAGPCDTYLVFRSSPPLYASAVSISNLLNVTATPGDEVEMEEHQNWKKNALVLYDLVISQPLEWPSLTVQWLPSHSRRANHLLLADATLPLPPCLAAAAAAASGAVPAPPVSISRSVPHKGEVNRARCMPQRPYTVATKTCVDEVHVYHLGDGGEKSDVDVVLRGHEAKGYGLAPAQSTVPFQVSISTSRSTIAADVPTCRSAASPSRGFAATLTKMTKGGREREMRKGEKRGKRERRLMWTPDMWVPC
uniref:Histone-binding protein RBBP4-like N-terminal domain-containing protein n=1 Tax=Oryza glumipatula TaxID=40148 RepID=A0A0E0AJZ6_9ORYZ